MTQARQTIFLTGASGFIGPLLLKSLLEKKFRVIMLVRATNESLSERVNDIFEKAKIPHEYLSEIVAVCGDITERNLGLEPHILAEFKGKIAEVWHLAASISFRYRDREKNFLTNLGGTRNVADFIEIIGANSFFYVSTVYIRGSYRGIVHEQRIARPDKFTNSYEETKWEAENFIFEKLHAKNLETVIFRLSIIVGNEKYVPENNFGYYNFLASIHELKNRVIAFPKVVKLLLRLIGIRSENKNVYCKIPFPCLHNRYLNLVPADKVIYCMDKISAHHRNRHTPGIFVYNIADRHPISLNSLFHETFHTLGLYIPIVHAHLLVLHTLFRFIILSSAFFPFMKKFSRSIFYYKNYILGESQYDVKNTEEIVGKDFFMSTLLTPQELRGVIAGFLSKGHSDNK